LAAAVGLSVVVPIVGFVAVTFPVVGVALAQFGWSDHLALVMICYLIIQLLDAYVLTPMLFSEANDLHPLIIIVSVLVFGSIWGFWGVFFAIPMALLVKVIISAWPTRRSSLGVDGRTGEKDE
jgi:putative permease